MGLLRRIADDVLLTLEDFDRAIETGPDYVRIEVESTPALERTLTEMRRNATLVWRGCIAASRITR